MGFAIKKAVEWCLSPLGLTVILLVAGVVAGLLRRERLGRGLVAAGLATLVLFSLPAVAVTLGGALVQRFPALMFTSPPGGVVAVVVLGAGSDPNVAKPPTGWLPSPGIERLVEGVRLLRLIPGASLVVSGHGRPGEPSAAEAMGRAAESLGVDRSRIVRMDDPRDTAEEIAAIRTLLGDQKIIIVTSAEHMPRAMALAARAGLHAVAAPAPVARGDGSQATGWLVPSVAALGDSSAAVHELLGLVWAKLVGLA